MTGQRFYPHQRYIADVAGELRPDGRRRYMTVIVIIPRQQGKTTLVNAALVRSTRQGPHRTAVYAAQDRQAAANKIIDELGDDVLAPHPLYGRRLNIRRSNGSQSLRWKDPAAFRSLVTIVANNDSSGHGLTSVDDVVLDEAFSHRDLTVINALAPTMTVAFDPQLTITSTVGDGGDGLLQHYEEIGEASLHDPDTTVAYFKWTAADDDDPDDPDVWRRVMPALACGGITVERIRALKEGMSAGPFERAYLNRRPQVAEVSDLDMGAWAEASHDDVPVAPYVLAFDITLDRTAATVAVAGRTDAGTIGVAVDRRDGTAWLLDEVCRLVAERSVAAVYADRRAGAGGAIDELRARGVPVTELGAPDLVSFCGQFVDELDQRTLSHNDQTQLNDAVAGAKKRPLGEAFAWSKANSLNDVSPLVAASVAVGAHRRLYPPGARLERIT